MRFFRWRREPEARASLENPSVPISSPAILQFFGLDTLGEPVEPVTVDSAMGVPAVWAAVNFLSSTMAALPIHCYRKKRDGARERFENGAAELLHFDVNDEMSSFQWREYIFGELFTQGRGLTFIEKNGAGRPINLWPLDPTKTTIERRNGVRHYKYRENGLLETFAASEIIDIPFKLKSDGLRHYAPIATCAGVIAHAQAMTKYGAKYFANGGVPPFAIEGPFETPAGATRASADLERAVAEAARANRQSLALPRGHTIKSLGADPEKSQMVEANRFVVEQIARLYSLPPVFLQDLTHGTFSNTEQQDLHLTKHTVSAWVKKFEGELNLKLFGRGRRSRFAEMNVDGLLRGDFKSRMEGYAHAVQNAIRKPSEIRAMENLPHDPAGDVLLIQGATVPLGAQPMPGEGAGPEPGNGGENDET